MLEVVFGLPATTNVRAALFRLGSGFEVVDFGHVKVRAAVQEEIELTESGRLKHGWPHVRDHFQNVSPRHGPRRFKARFGGLAVGKVHFLAIEDNQLLA